MVFNFSVSCRLPWPLDDSERPMTIHQHSSIDEEVLRLIREWRDHKNDECASINTVSAIFGIASRCGRIADNYEFNNDPYIYWLDDIAYDYGLADASYAIETSDRGQSSAAKTMTTNRLFKRCNRRVPITKDTQRALLIYLNEKLELLVKIEDALITAGPRELKRQRAKIRKHRAAIQTLVGEVWRAA